MLYVVCCMLYVACCVLRVACCVLRVPCCVLYVVCCMPHSVLCEPHAVHCMLMLMSMLLCSEWDLYFRLLTHVKSHNIQQTNEILMFTWADFYSVHDKLHNYCTITGSVNVDGSLHCSKIKSRTTRIIYLHFRRNYIIYCELMWKHV